MEMVYGAVKWRRALEWVVEGCAERKPDPAVLPYLFVGLYQVLLMDNVAHYAAVNETVEAMKSDRDASVAGGFVNGILRRVLRERDRIRLSPGERAFRPRGPRVATARPHMVRNAILQGKSPSSAARERRRPSVGGSRRSTPARTRALGPS